MCVELAVLSSVGRPDVTFAVDWKLKANYLSTCLSSVDSVLYDRHYLSVAATKTLICTFVLSRLGYKVDLFFKLLTSMSTSVAATPDGRLTL